MALKARVLHLGAAGGGIKAAICPSQWCHALGMLPVPCTEPSLASTLVWMSSGTAILRQLPTSGVNREASGVRVVVLRPPLCELPLTR